jgi:hypothetical protein
MRPWYLVAAMLLTWLIGVQGLMSGCSVVTLLRQGSIADVSAEVGKQETSDPLQTIPMVIQAAQLKAMGEAQEVTFPLNAAKLLLSGMLVIMSGLAMSGRPGVRALALQVVVANALLAVADYALTRSVRAGWIDAVARAGEMLPQALPQRDIVMNHATWWWVARIRFGVFELGVFALAALALTRRRTRGYFDAVAEAAESAEEP